MKRILAAVMVLVMVAGVATAQGDWKTVRYNTNSGAIGPDGACAAIAACIGFAPTTPGGTGTGVPTAYSTADLWWGMTSNFTASLRVADESTSGNDGTMFPAASPPVWTNYSLDLGGNAVADPQYVKEGNGWLLSDDTAATYAAWVRLDNTLGDTGIGFLWGCSGDGSLNVLSFHSVMIQRVTPWPTYYGSGGVYLTNTYVAARSGNIGVPITNILNATWHRVVVTYKSNETVADAEVGNISNGSQSLYVDGILVDNTNLVRSVNVIAKGNMTLGRDTDYSPAGATNLPGQYDDFVIDDVAWSPGQVWTDFRYWRSLSGTPAEITGLATGTVAATTAALTGTMGNTDRGNVTLLYGFTDGGESLTGWDSTVDLGWIVPERGDTVSNLVTGLTSGTNYNWRFFSQNWYSLSWSTNGTFTTP